MHVVIAPDAAEMGRWSASHAADCLRDAIAQRGSARLIVATGASQFSVLDALCGYDDIAWEKVTGFHLDEYVGLDETHAASFCRYLRERFVSRIPIGAFHFLPGEQPPHDVIARVGPLLQSEPIDLAMVGIGENGHLAFNDPPANFESDDPYLIVELDEACRMQQVGEGWFESLDAVPTHAISMSIRQILKSRTIICSVPDERKSTAVRNTVEGSVTPDVPASILQQHEHTWLVLDESAANPAQRINQVIGRAILMTGLLDLQVNGHAGLDFNSDDWTESQLIACCEDLKRRGVAGVLATVITAPREQMLHRIGKIVSAIGANSAIAEVIRGIHVEGPFLNANPGYIGAHPVHAACESEPQFADALLELCGPLLRIVTLAPEMDPQCRVTRLLADSGVVVAGGHSDASYDQLSAAVDAGMRLYTHCGNGCPTTLPRHDNIIQRVLSLSDQIFISWIADGHHVPWFALSNYLKAVPPEHVIIVSDSMSAAGLGPGRYQLGDQWVEVDKDLAAWKAGRTQFAGSATPLSDMCDLLADHLKATRSDIEQWTVANPHRLCAL